MFVLWPTPCEMETGNKAVSLLFETYDVVRELIQRSCFNRRSLTGSETFSLLTAVDATILTLRHNRSIYTRKNKTRRELDQLYEHVLSKSSVYYLN